METPFLDKITLGILAQQLDSQGTIWALTVKDKIYLYFFLTLKIQEPLHYRSIVPEDWKPVKVRGRGHHSEVISPEDQGIPSLLSQEKHTQLTGSPLMDPACEYSY